MGENYRQILLALCGKSPAVITETIYALNREDAPFIPEEIIALTTSEGRDCIEKELFETKLWDRFKKKLKASSGKLKFGLSSNSIRLIPGASRKYDASDIVTNADNDSASDFIMETLRQFTENPDTQIIFSIAGGRKTMSALSALAMTMLGRKQDRLCHVLVNPPFDSPDLIPKFYYPDSGIKNYMTRDGKRVPADKVEINLCYVRFPRLRYLFGKQLMRLPGTYLDTVELANSMIHPDSAEMPELVLRPDSLNCEIGEVKVPLNAAEFAVYWFFAVRRKDGLPPLRGQKAMHKEFLVFSKSISSMVMPEIIHQNYFRDKSDDDMRKLVFSISQKIRKTVGFSKSIAFCLPSNSDGVYGISISADKISCPRNY